MVLALALALVLLTTPVWAAPSRDGTPNSSSANGTSVSFSVTVGTGLNRMLFCSVGTLGGVATGLTVNGSAAGVSLVDSRNRTNDWFITTWRLLAPPSGSLSIVASRGTSGSIIAGCIPYKDVHQSVTFGTAAGGSGDSAGPSVTVTSAGNDLVVDAVVVDGGVTGSVGAGQSSGINSTGAALVLLMSDEPGALSVVMSWTLSGTKNWASSGIAIKPAATDLINPTDPSGLTAQGVTSSTITLAVAGACTDANPIAYLLERSSGATCTGFGQVASSPTPSFTDTGLASSTTRCYRVRCTDGTNFSVNYTNTATATTLAPQTVRLHWTHTGDESNFAARRCEPVYPATTCDPTGAAGAQVATTGADIVDLTLSSSEPNPAACYTVFAQKVGAPDSGFSNTKCVLASSTPTVPGVATGVSVVQP